MNIHTVKMYIITSVICGRARTAVAPGFFVNRQFQQIFARNLVRFTDCPHSRNSLYYIQKAGARTA